jgi:ATP-dependent exoDNAse (exonuclease V) beta subunit
MLVWSEAFDDDGKLHVHMEAKPRKGTDDTRYKEVARAGDAKQKEELKRLFYVACTRAKNQLVLCANAEFKKDRAGLKKVRANTFLELIWPSVSSSFEQAARLSTPAGSDEQDRVSRDTLRRLPSTWRLPVFERSVEWQPQFQRSTASARLITYEWVSEQRRHIGVVVHDLLKRAAEQGANFNLKTLLASAPMVESELQRLGVPGPERAAALESALRAVRNTLESDKGRWMLAAHQESRVEWPLAGIIGDKLVTGTVDRAFRDASGRMWIIDYKTSEHGGGNLDAFLDEEVRRYRSQLENYAILMSRLIPGPFHVGLYFPLLDAWREWEFAEEIAADYTGQ